MEKIVVCVMGQNCEKFIGMCLESVKDADAIVYCDGRSEDNTIKIVDSYWNKVKKGIIIQNEYNQEDKTMNGKQRNFYLDYLKKNYKGYWALCLDADEILEDEGIEKIRRFIKTIQKEGEDILFSPRMRHFIGDLGHEDATQQVHFVPHRFFKIKDDLFYSEVEHSILQSKKDMRSGNLPLFTIWHLREVLGIFGYKKKFLWNTKKSNMHTNQELKMWYYRMIYGDYPKIKIPIYEIPSPIKKEFLLE